jgi:hypothetical protein
MQQTNVHDLHIDPLSFAAHLDLDFLAHQFVQLSHVRRHYRRLLLVISMLVRCH